MSNKDKKESPKTIKFKSYTPEVISLIVPPSMIIKDKNLTDFTFEVRVSEQVSFENNMITLLVQYVIFAESSKTTLLADIITNHGFVVEGLNKHLESIEDPAKLRFSNGFIGTLVGIALSTSRGLIIGKLQGVFANVPILPIINPMDLIAK